MNETSTPPPDDRAAQILRLAAVGRWGRLFFATAAEVSLSPRQVFTLQGLELRRTIMVQELQAVIQPDFQPLVAQVRAAAGDDQEILRLCECLDQETLSIYRAELQSTQDTDLKSILELHIASILEGNALHSALRRLS